MRKSIGAHLVFFCGFALILFITHAPVLDLPYFWDEMGQFVPAALDILESGAWIPQSTLPNVHPPGVMAYLAAFWGIFGYSVTHTRIAMLLLASLGVLFTFLLAMELGKSLQGWPAFTSVLLLLASPLFWSQSMVAQLDMPTMVFSVLALLLFLRDRFLFSALACTCAVLMKETSLAVPLVLGAFLLWERRWPQAAWFVLPAIAVSGWLAYLYSGTGHLFGNPEFAHYNTTFQLHPVRLLTTLVRRAFFLFADNFHWIGTLALAQAWRKTALLRTRAWAVVALVALAQIFVVSVLGGAALERYLVPVLPLVLIGMASAMSTLRSRTRHTAVAAMTLGLACSLFLPSPFPYPYENNAAFVDFVRLQQTAASFVEANYPASSIMSAWPFPDALRRPEFGYVSRPLTPVGLENFNLSTLTAARDKGSVLVLYSRTSEPPWSVVQVPAVKHFLEKYYFYETQISPQDVKRVLDMTPVARWERHGQWIEVYARTAPANTLTL